MQGYEIVTIVDPQIADEDVPKTSEKINEFITSRGGSIARVQRWGRRRLAYPLQRHTEAHYLLTTFALEPQHASELEADLVLAQEVLKHMVIKVDEAEFQKAADEPPKPAAVVTQAKPAESAEPAKAPVAEAPAVETPVEEVSEPATAENPGGAVEATEQPEAEVKRRAVIMVGLNKMMVIGNLGTDPEMRYTPNGNAVTSFRIAVSRSYTPKDGERRQETEWFRIVAWNKQAESCNQYLTKGQTGLCGG